MVKNVKLLQKKLKCYKNSIEDTEPQTSIIARVIRIAQKKRGVAQQTLIQIRIGIPSWIHHTHTHSYRWKCVYKYINRCNYARLRPNGPKGACTWLTDTDADTQIHSYIDTNGRASYRAEAASMTKNMFFFFLFPASESESQLDAASVKEEQTHARNC